MSAVLAYLPLAVAVAFAVLTGHAAFRLLTARLHPLRILSTALSSTLYLLVWAIAVPLGLVLGIIWWAIVLATLAGIVVASLRALRPMPVDDGTDQAAVASPRDLKRQRRRLKLLTPPSRFELILNAVLAVGALVVVAFSG